VLVLVTFLVGEGIRQVPFSVPSFGIFNTSNFGSRSMKSIAALLFLSLLSTAPCDAQINIVNSATFGTRTAQFAGDPAAGMPYLQSFGDSTARPFTAGSDMIIFSPTSDSLMTARGGTAWIWDPSSGAERAVIPQGGAISLIAYSPDGSFVVVCNGSQAKIWSTPSGQFVGLLPSNDTIRTAAISKDGKYIATATASGFSVWSSSGANNVFQMPTSAPVDAVLFSPDGVRMLTLGGGSASLYQVADGARIGTIAHESPVRGALFSGDGRYVVVGTTNWAHLWDAVGFRKISDLQYGGGYK
jgi:WD40 repeat protein